MHSAYQAYSVNEIYADLLPQIFCRRSFDSAQTAKLPMVVLTHYGCCHCNSSMTGLAAIPPDLLTRAGVAYVHYLSFMLCFGALVLERRLIKANPSKQDATLMVITDVVYGIAALALLGSGILRVLYFGQGSEFYTENPLFWWKVGVYLAVGGLSLYPTITYILWAIPLRKGELPQVSEALAKRLAWILNIELVGFAAIPLMATLMARGVGLPG